jgi:imidazolonepropionase-like amidohydrolase
MNLGKALHTLALVALLTVAAAPVRAQAPAGRAAGAQATPILLVPDRVWDGTPSEAHAGWVVLVRGDRIEAVGAAAAVTVPAGARRIELPGTTLIPGMIEGHSHLLLHPYNETPWNDQVLHESEALRVARAVNHARASLLAGFTTTRDLGTEGAGYADVGIKQAINQGIIPGPRMIVTTKAIIATGSYGPSGFATEYSDDIPQGAEEADGVDELTRVVRDQIRHGADWIKMYADYRWGPTGQSLPTFTEAELKLAVEVAGSAGRPVVAHANTAEGMRRATIAGVRSIEHGGEGTPEVFALMKQRGVFFCPTMAATAASSIQNGSFKVGDPLPANLARKGAVVKQALDAGVTICAGGDSGVFTHGDNAFETELLVQAGLSPIQGLMAVTANNARMLQMENQIGAVKAGLFADLVAVTGDPTRDILTLSKPVFVMKSGAVVRQP